MSIVTEGFVLRSLDEKGIEPLRRWSADPRVAKALGQAPRRLSEAAARAFVQSFDNRTRYLLGIHDRRSDELLGYYTIHVDHRHLTATLSLVIGEAKALEQAVAAETARAVAGWAFETAGLEKVIGLVAETNQLVAGWLGRRMQLEGRLRDEIRLADGSRMTVLRFGLLKSEWAALRERSIARQKERGFDRRAAPD